MSGASLARPRRVAVTGTTTNATFDGGQFSLNQPLDAATAGKAVSMTWDVLVSGAPPNSTLTVEIERGDLGATTVTLSNYLGARPIAVESVTWAGLSGGLNRRTVTWPARVVVKPVPPKPNA